MILLDIDELFPIIPLDETLSIDIELLFKKITVSSLNKRQLLETLLITLEKSIIVFDNKYYSQSAEVGMEWLWCLVKIMPNVFCPQESNQNIAKDL